MAYGLEVKEKAFAAYCLNGGNIDGTVAYMRTTFPEQAGSLHRNTLLKWKELFAWDGRKRKIEADIRAQNDEKLVSERREMLGELRAIRQRIREKLDGVELKSLEGGVNAYGSILKWILKLTGEDAVGKRDPLEVIDVVFQVLGEHPSFGKLIAQHEDFLLGTIESRLRG